LVEVHSCHGGCQRLLLRLARNAAAAAAAAAATAAER